MPIFSYLAYPKPGVMTDLLDDLTTLDHCEARPAENEEIVILITDTPDESSEKKLQQEIASLNSLQSLSMTFGHVDA